jgi:hypothetical protein
LNEFKTVDSIGDVDGEEGKCCTSSFASRNSSLISVSISVESAMEDDEFDSKETAVGTEFVNKIEVNYCSLCREYLSRSSNDERVIADHCKSKKHLKWYYQSKKKEAKSPAKKTDETGETSKEDVTSTSIQEGEKAKKSSEKEEKSIEISKETEKKDEKSGEKGDEDESSTKFTR